MCISTCTCFWIRSSQYHLDRCGRRTSVKKRRRRSAKKAFLYPPAVVVCCILVVGSWFLDVETWMLDGASSLCFFTQFTLVLLVLASQSLQSSPMYSPISFSQRWLTATYYTEYNWLCLHRHTQLCERQEQTLSYCPVYCLVIFHHWVTVNTDLHFSCVEIEKKKETSQLCSWKQMWHTEGQSVQSPAKEKRM